LLADENSGASQPAHTYVPGRFSRYSGLVNARSVPASRSTRNCSSLSWARHSPLERETSGFVDPLLPGGRLLRSRSMPRYITPARRQSAEKPIPATALLCYLGLGRRLGADQPSP
jgi:hypothetical protein